MIQTKNDFVALSKEELNALSKEVFGSSSRWVKLMQKGVPNPEVVNKVVPGKDGKPEFKQFKTGKSGVYRYSLQQVQEIMLGIKKSKPEPAPTPVQAGDKITIHGKEFDVKDVEFSR